MRAQQLLVKTGLRLYLGFALALLPSSLSAQSSEPATISSEVDTVLARSSRIDLQSLNAQQVENLVALGHIWGFLKYHHPAVVQGKYNWDAELLRELTAVLSASTKQARSRIFMEWLDRLGPVPGIATPDPAVSAAPDLAWFTSSGLFSQALFVRLLQLRNSRTNDQQYYVRLVSPSTPMPVFQHEEAYPVTAAVPPAALRLLALYRYWNIVAYFYPYKSETGQDWNKILPEFIPRFAQANDPLQYRLVVLALLAQLHDVHAVLKQPEPLLEAYWGMYAATAHPAFVQGKAVVSRVDAYPFLAPSALQKGDIIRRVGGLEVASFLKQQRPLTAGPNEATQLRNIASRLLRGATPQVQVEVERNGQLLTVQEPRFLRHSIAKAARLLPTEASYSMMQPGIGYVNIGRLQALDVPPMMRAFEHTKGLVVDLRNYPADGVYERLTPYFTSKPIVFSSVSHPDMMFPGQFVKFSPFILSPGPHPTYAGKLIILVNELTQSAAEQLAMALRACEHSRIIGSQTAGSMGDVAEFYLPGGILTGISALGVYYPDGGQTQRVGIKVDETVVPTISGLREGRDEVLEKALSLLK